VLTIHPRSGIQFVKPGLELTKSTYQYRTIVERAAVRVYAETADETELETIAARHRAAIAALDAHGLTPELNAELEALELLLHNAVIHSLDNPLIETAYRRMHNYLRLVRLDRRDLRIGADHAPNINPGPPIGSDHLDTLSKYACECIHKSKLQC
jgi:DNA-binding GntR family transcriptional regulator